MAISRKSRKSKSRKPVAKRKAARNGAKRRMMTKAEVVRSFREAYPAETFHRGGRDGRVSVDRPMRRQAWNDYVDSLNRNGYVSDKQAATWSSPFDY